MELWFEAAMERVMGHRGSLGVRLKEGAGGLGVWAVVARARFPARRSGSAGVLEKERRWKEGDDRWARMVSGTSASRAGGCMRARSDADTWAILVSG